MGQGVESWVAFACGVGSSWTFVEIERGVQKKTTNNECRIFGPVSAFNPPRLAFKLFVIF